MKIGVLSDTHGYLPDTVLQHFRDVDHILHAGDIGSEDIIFTLETIAPVTAVYGNSDHYPLTKRYRLNQLIQLMDYRIFLCHEPGYPFSKWYEQISYLANYQKVSMIVYGHTHLGKIDWINDTLFLNPGSVYHGKRTSPRTLAIVTLPNQGLPETKLINL